MTDPLPLKTRFRELAALYDQLDKELTAVAADKSLLEPYLTMIRRMAIMASLSANACRDMEADWSLCTRSK